MLMISVRLKKNYWKRSLCLDLSVIGDFISFNFRFCVKCKYKAVFLMAFLVGIST